MTSPAAEEVVHRLLRATVIPAWARHERSPYLDVARRLRRDESLSLAAREEQAFLRLRSMVAYAAERVPFYRDRFREIGFAPEHLRSPGDVSRLPILTKQDIREQGSRLQSEDFSDAQLVTKRTSGSTGVSLYVKADANCMDIRRGITLYRDRWTGWDMGEPRAMVWGNPPARPGLRGRLRRSLLEREFYLDTLRMNEEAMDAFAREVVRRRPTLFYGHAHSLYLFARFWRGRGLPAPAPRGIISTAMVLHAHERQAIEAVFQSRVFDRYGCEEVSLIASECESHEGLHLNSDGVWVEIENDPGHPALPGRLIVTDLLNRGMPLLRYEVGDRAELRDTPCGCGRPYPMLRHVSGRIADYLITPNGDYVSGISLTENFATLIPGVKQVQVVQDRRDHILVRLVPDPRFGDDSRDRIAALVRERFGAAMTYEVVLVDQIAPGPSGKYRFSICQIPELELVSTGENRT